MACHIVRIGGDSSLVLGRQSGSLGDGSPPVGSRGEAPVGGLGDEVPQKLKRFFANMNTNVQVRLKEILINCICVIQLHSNKKEQCRDI